MMKFKAAHFCIMMMIALSCIGCSGNQSTQDSASSTPVSTVLPTITATADEIGGDESSAIIAPDQGSSSADIVLPISRQVPPPEIQGQVQWFDGGATGPVSNCERIYCESGQYDGSSNTSVVQWYQPEGVLYEGDDVVFCLKGLVPWEPFTFTLETPENDVITKLAEANADGEAKLCPYFNPLHGLYQLHLTSETKEFYAEFEMLSPPSPRIWSSGLVEPGQTFTLHYAGFEPKEVITTVWYISDSSPNLIERSEYFTSWQVQVDNSGYTEQSIYIPSGFGDCHSLVVTQSQKGTRGEWLSGGYYFILSATSVAELVIYGSSVDEELSVNEQVDEVIIDDSSSLLLLEGPSEGWRTAPYGYEGSTHWTYCTNEGVSNWAKWIPSLPDGYHEVFVFIPEHNAGTTQAQYRIFHNGSEDIVIISQADFANEWVKLGEYYFVGDWQEYIYLDDNTGEPRSSNTTIAFDAVKFVYIP
jgi:hypothetical protein